MLLDSTFINDLVREDENAVAYLDQLIADETDVTISPLTVFEVGIGLRGGAEKYAGRYRRTVHKMDVAPVDRAVAENARVNQLDLYNQGTPIGAVDILIASTALVHADRHVVTRNVGEFERVPGLAVETY